MAFYPLVPGILKGSCFPSYNVLSCPLLLPSCLKRYNCFRNWVLDFSQYRKKNFFFFLTIGNAPFWERLPTYYFILKSFFWLTVDHRICRSFHYRVWKVLKFKVLKWYYMPEYLNLIIFLTYIGTCYIMIKWKIFQWYHLCKFSFDFIWLFTKVTLFYNIVYDLEV